MTCCRKVSSGINEWHDTVVNIVLDNILIQRRMTDREQKWEDRKQVRTARDEVSTGTEHWRSDEWKGKRACIRSEAEAGLGVAQD